MILPPADSYHTPALLTEVLAGLKIRPGAKYIDATLGGGGYAFAIAKKGGFVLGVDRDDDALARVGQNLEKEGDSGGIKGKIVLSKGNFGDLGGIAKANDFGSVAGIVFDLGMSSHQLEGSGRGFSFRKPGEPLDMRMEKDTGKTAADILNHYSEGKLYEIFSKYAEELNSGPIASAVFRARTLEPIKRVGQLAEIVGKAVSGSEGKYPSSSVNNTLARIFQALRIEVNDEMTNLTAGLIFSVELLERGGRLCAVSYHSLEDRQVKSFFRTNSRKAKLKIITGKPVTASIEELRNNRRARGAKLRVCEKV